MAEMIRVRIGAVPTYLPANETQRSVAYVRVAEPKSELIDGKWVEQESQWYDAHFRGGWADRIHEEYRTGDALVLIGEKEHRVRETADGRAVKSMRFYVSGFGPDPLLSNISLDRTRSGEASQGIVQDAAQTVAASAENAAEGTQNSLFSADVSDEEYERRVADARANEYVDPAFAAMQKSTERSPWDVVNEARQEVWNTPAPQQSHRGPSM